MSMAHFATGSFGLSEPEDKVRETRRPRGKKAGETSQWTERLSRAVEVGKSREP